MVREAIPLRRYSNRNSPATLVVVVHMEPIRTAASKVTISDKKQVKEYTVPTLVDGSTARQKSELARRGIPILNNALLAKKAAKLKNWIVDSGAAFHLVNKSDLPVSIQREIYKATHPVILLSANGEVPESGRLQLRSSKLARGFETTVLEDTPNVFSLGKLVVEEGYDFHWTSDKPPYLKSPQGDEIELNVIDFVPFIDIGELTEAQKHRLQHTRGFKGLVTKAEKKKVILPGKRSSDSESKDAPPTGSSGGEHQSAEDSYDTDGEVFCQPCEPVSSLDERLNQEANSLWHMMTHLPMNKYCRWCQRAKLAMKHARSRRPRGSLPMDIHNKFGTLTADWMVAKDADPEGIDHEKHCMLVYDLWTHFVMAYPRAFRNTTECMMSLKHYAGQQKVLTFYSDRGAELIKSAKELRWLHDVSLPYMHTKNAIIERRNQLILRGTRTILMRSGLP